jgi:hypothetical protein
MTETAMNITRRQATVGGALSLLAGAALNTRSLAQTSSVGVIRREPW